MSAPVSLYTILPIDSGNAGKCVRTQTDVVGGQTIYEHFLIPTWALTVIGHYFFSSSLQPVSSSIQDGVNTGFLWFINPASSTITTMLRRIILDFSAGLALSAPTAPVVSFTKFTYTGSPLGGTFTPASAQTGQASAQVSIRQSSQGLTITKLADFGQAAFPSLETSVGLCYVVKEVLPFNPFAYQRGLCLECGPGEGIAIWQSVAGSGADSRRFSCQVEWDELDLS